MPQHNNIFARDSGLLLAAGLLLLLTLTQCERTVILNYPDLPPNPFDEIDYGQGVLGELPLDSSSLLGLHHYIFAPKCAQPGCHDGNFEPDFRTPMSAFHNLVYHPVIKNDEGENFDYRVLPGNRSKSWLWERVTTDDPVLGRMPLYDSLSAEQIEAIGRWIDLGAPDIMGQVAGLPNTQPTVFGWLAYDQADATRYDLNRTDLISPMQLPYDRNIIFYFGAYDLDDQGLFGAGHTLGYNKARISPHPYNVEAEALRDLDVLGPFEPFIGPVFFDESVLAPYHQRLVINTAEFVRNRPYFVRLYVQDGQHDQPSEWPNSGSPYYILSLMSFVVL